MTTNERNRRKREKRFREQGGLCWWCKKPMQLLKLPGKVRAMPRDLCTLDHLDDRYSPERGKHPFERRIVAACWQCNFDRNREREKSLPLDILRERSGRHPVAMTSGDRE